MERGAGVVDERAAAQGGGPAGVVGEGRAVDDVAVEAVVAVDVLQQPGVGERGAGGDGEVAVDVQRVAGDAHRRGLVERAALDAHGGPRWRQC